MLKEEKELRKWMKGCSPINVRQFNADIAALVKACYEDAAKVSEYWIETGVSGKIPAAIRERK